MLDTLKKYCSYKLDRLLYKLTEKESLQKKYLQTNAKEEGRKVTQDVASIAASEAVITKGQKPLSKIEFHLQGGPWSGVPPTRSYLMKMSK